MTDGVDTMVAIVVIAGVLIWAWTLLDYKRAADRFLFEALGAIRWVLGRLMGRHRNRRS